MNIGFVGFGEAAFHIARGLTAQDAHVYAFDINTHTKTFGDLIQKRASESQVVLVESVAALAQASDTILSAVTAASAVQAAADCARVLSSNHIYADLNSVSPATKRIIAGQITASAKGNASGAQFVEVAVMAPVPPYGHRVPMLLNGPAAQLLADRLTPLGMRLDIMHGEPGAASAVKLCRSIVVKGLEALLLECVLASGHFGADGRVFASLAESYPGIDWPKLASYAIGRVVVHGERRSHEMAEVADMLREIGIEPMMAEATARRQAWGGALKGHFDPDGPKLYQDVLALLKAESSPDKT